MKSLHYRVLTYNTIRNARIKALKQKKLYGYMPEVFRVKENKTGTRFAIVVPKGLKIGR